MGPDDPAEWRNYSIYKIPSIISNRNQNAYMPQMVSFGPYHHGKMSFRVMEEHKQRALLRFLKRTPQSVQSIRDSLLAEAQKLKDSYASLDKKWHEGTERFLRLMVVDGCFMLEILRVEKGIVSDYQSDDPVFGERGRSHLLPLIKRDMLLLENQLPMVVLIKLLGAINRSDSEEVRVEILNWLILSFCNPTARYRDFGKCLHVLDLYRKSLLSDNQSYHNEDFRDLFHNLFLASATELNESGICFEKSKSSYLDDISFKGGVLKLPCLFADDEKVWTFLNLIAFEQLHVGAGHDIMSFVWFIDKLVQEERDIGLLCSARVFHNATRSYVTAFKQLKTATRDLAVHPRGKLRRVRNEVAGYCELPWNKWRALLIHAYYFFFGKGPYFRRHWALLSVMAAILFFCLTMAQTIFSVLQYQQGRNRH